MPLEVRLNGDADSEGFLLAPSGNVVFPVPLALRVTDGATLKVDISASPGGAGLAISPSSIEVGYEWQTVEIRALTPSLRRNDTAVHFHANGLLQESIAVTVVTQPRLFFDGGFEVRFATNDDPYNHPRGNPDGTGTGWMWALEGEPDFVPKDSVPDHLEKPVGRVIRFHDPAVNRSFARPVGVFVRAVVGLAGGTEETFTSGDPIIGLPVNLGPHSYFASNQPVSQADRDAGRLPEEQHPDGFQPIANFECHIGKIFSGGSRVGPHAPGTTESRQPRDPDFRPFGQGLDARTEGERTRYPFPAPKAFEAARVDAILPEYVKLKANGQTGTLEFRNLQTRLAHLVRRLDDPVREELLTAHSDTGLADLGFSPSFGWNNREVYRGLINDKLMIAGSMPGMTSYLARFDALHFLCVFFNFHTDDARGQCYGSIDPMAAPPTL
jgi:hypothetical protein